MHLIAATVLSLYIYSPLADDPVFQFSVRWVTGPARAHRPGHVAASALAGRPPASRHRSAIMTAFAGTVAEVLAAASEHDPMVVPGLATCMLRTEQPRNVALYVHLGFRLCSR